MGHAQHYDEWDEGVVDDWLHMHIHHVSVATSPSCETIWVPSTFVQSHNCIRRASRLTFATSRTVFVIWQAVSQASGSFLDALPLAIASCTGRTTHEGCSAC